MSAENRFLLIGLILTVIYVQILNKLDFAEEIYRNVIYLVIFPRRKPGLRRAHRSSVRFIGRSNAGRAAGCGALPVSVRRTVPVERRGARHGEKRADAEAFVRAFSVSVAHFPETCRDAEARGYLWLQISTANLLGLGSAATPMGVGCVHRMQTLSPTPERAGNEMCRLIVMNTASVQLLPTTVAALRAVSAQTAPLKFFLPCGSAPSARSR